MTRQLRSEVFFRVRIVKLIIVVRLLGDRVKILGKLPFKRFRRVAEPHYFTARSKARIQRSVTVDCIHIIAKLGFVPDTHVNDYLSAVGNIGYTDAIRREGDIFLIIERSAVKKIQPRKGIGGVGRYVENASAVLFGSRLIGQVMITGSETHGILSAGIYRECACFTG